MEPPKLSPIKESPPREPGQSLTEQINTLRDDKLMEYFLMATILVILAAAEWWKSIFNVPLSPKTYSFIAFCGVLFAAYKIRPGLKELKKLRMARDGEKDVAKILDPLKADGYQIIHDLPVRFHNGVSFNIDHVVVGPRGVFAIETKTRSKGKGNPKVHYDGSTISTDGFETRQPLDQALSNAKWIQQHLESTTGRKVPVQPVIVYPGWWVETTSSNPKVWVLNPKNFRSWLKFQKEYLSAQDINVLMKQLNQYVEMRAMAKA